MTVIPGTELDAAAPAGGTALKQLEQRFRLSAALAERGLELNTLSPDELRELETDAHTRLSPVLDRVADDWKQQHEDLSELEKIDRELRRPIVGERDTLDTAFECEGCGYRHRDDDHFVEFHDLFLCDGCTEHARNVLHELQRPLLEALEAEPTLEHALALGYQLIRHQGRLTWVSDHDHYDGDSYPYADEHEALENLVDELS